MEFQLAVKNYTSNTLNIPSDTPETSDSSNSSSLQTTPNSSPNLQPHPGEIIDNLYLDLDTDDKCQFYIFDRKKRCHRKVKKDNMYCCYHMCYHHFPREPCSVCYDEIHIHEKPLNPCGHWVHMKCLIKSGKDKCPICRSSIKLTKNQMNELQVYERELKMYLEDVNENMVRDLLEPLMNTEVGVLFQMLLEHLMYSNFEIEDEPEVNNVNQIPNSS